MTSLHAKGVLSKIFIVAPSPSSSNRLGQLFSCSSPHFVESATNVDIKSHLLGVPSGMCLEAAHNAPSSLYDRETPWLHLPFDTGGIGEQHSFLFIAITVKNSQSQLVTKARH